MFIVSALLAISIVQHTGTLHASAYVFTHTSIVFILVWLLVFERLGLYRSSFAFAPRDEFYYTVAALFIGIVPQLGLYTLIPAMSTSRLILVLSAAISIPMVAGMRYVLHRVRTQALTAVPERVAIVGNRQNMDEVAQSLAVPENVPILCIESENPAAALSGVRTHGTFSVRDVGWLTHAIEWGCDRLILTEFVPPAVLPPLLATALRYDFSIAFAPPRLVSHAYSLSLRTDGHQVLLSPAPVPACGNWAAFSKRTCDLIVGTAAVIIAAPLMLACALAIRLESPGPVLFKQKRVGRGGKEFEMYKFRSMRVNAEDETGPIWTHEGDNRVTRFGKIMRMTSLDELPQLFNVLRGEMSLVGPRPERQVFVEEFRRYLPRYDERHLVRPGITGCAQVHMRRRLEEAEIGEKLSYDLFYVENWSLFMDISLLFKTGFEVLFHRAR